MWYVMTSRAACLCACQPCRAKLRARWNPFLTDTLSVHCRRRKIRCLPADHDPHNRCQNCIRLKKDCQYFPVEQEGATDEQSQSSSRAGPSSTVSSSPAEIGSATSFDDREGPGGFPVLSPSVSNRHYGAPLQPSETLSSQGQFTRSLLNEAQVINDVLGSYSSAGYSYPEQGQHSQHQSPWQSSGTFEPPMYEQRAVGVGYATQYYAQPGPYEPQGDYSPFPSQSTQQIAHPTQHYYSPTQAYAQQPHPQQLAWQQHAAATDDRVQQGGAVYAPMYHMSPTEHSFAPMQMSSVSGSDGDDRPQTARPVNYAVAYTGYAGQAPAASGTTADQTTYGGAWLSGASGYPPGSGESQGDPARNQPDYMYGRG